MLEKLVWRQANERYDIACIRGTVKHDINIMVWGCFTAHAVGNLCLVDEIIDQIQYRSILEEELLPIVENCILKKHGIFSKIMTQNTQQMQPNSGL